jgi:hypothetical protein
MLKHAVRQTEDVHLAAAMTNIRSRKIKRNFTIRSTLLLKQTSYFVIRAAAFLLLLHTKLKKNLKEDQKIKEEFVRESLRHPRNVKTVYLNQNVKRQNLKVAKYYIDQIVATPHINLIVAKNIQNQKVANQKNQKILVNPIILVKNQILIKKKKIQRIVEKINKAKVDPSTQEKTKKEPLIHQLSVVVTLLLHL